MNDESFARYQGHIVDLAIRNQGYLPSGMGVNEIGSSLSGLRSNVIEARNEELNKYASRRRPEGLTARSQELKNQLTAAIHSDPIANATEVSEDVVRAVKSTSTSTSISTKARLAEDTLNAIEVVQSNRLSYAAVATGAGALVLGLGARNRRNSKKQL